MTAARAFDNTLHLVAANRFGRDKEYDFFGHSRILDPLGKVIAKLDEENYTFMKDRRPHTYAALVQPY
jgi:predicted amidohydrolase